MAVTKRDLEQLVAPAGPLQDVVNGITVGFIALGLGIGGESQPEWEER